jgi:hypothetical protein
VARDDVDVIVDDGSCPSPWCNSTAPRRLRYTGTQQATAGRRVGAASLTVWCPLKLHIAPVEAPLVVLLEHHGSDESHDGRIDGEDAHDVRAPLDLGVQAFQRVGAVDLRSALGRSTTVADPHAASTNEGKHVDLGVVHVL